MSCQGKPIEMQDLRTPEQKDVMAALGPLILAGINRGATPFGGQLSAPPDPSMLQAMNMMSQVGGQGPYRFPGMQTGPYPMPPQMSTGGNGGGGGGGGGGGVSPNPRRSGFEHPWEPQFDPYAPYKRSPNPKLR